MEGDLHTDDVCLGIYISSQCFSEFICWFAIILASADNDTAYKYVTQNKRSAFRAFQKQLEIPLQS